MAGDWIKMRTSLLTNPKVNGIAKALECDASVCNALSTGFSGVMSGIVKRNVMRHVTVSSLLVVWGSANEHTKDGVFVNSDLADLDDMTGIPTFGEAMASVGWAVYDEVSNSVTLPNFNEYNTSGSVRSATAKSNAQRQKEYRDRQKSQQSDVTSDVTALQESNRREEKRREEVNTDMSPAKLPTCPTDSVIAIYHTQLPTLPTVRLESETRTKAIGKFWKWVLTSKRTDGQPRATNTAEALAWIGEYFARANENDFLMGRNAQTGKHANWKADFDFLLTEKGKCHVIEKTGETA